MRSVQAARQILRLTEKIVEKNPWHDSRWSKVHEVIEVVGVSYRMAFKILRDILGIKKLSPMDATIIHGGQQANAVINFEAVFGIV